MIVRDSAAVISDALQAFTRRLDADAVLPGKLLLYTAPMPATAGADPVGCTLLVTFTLPKPSLDNVTAGVLTLADIDTELATNSGDAAWGRFVNGADQQVTDLDVGLTGEGAAITIAGASLHLYSGGVVTVLSVQRTHS